MKKILYIVPYNIFPPYWGAASRNFNLVKNLADDNKILLLINDHKQLQKHDLNCKEFHELKSNPNIQIFFVKSFGKFSQIFNLLIIKKALSIIKKEKPDLIIVEHLWSGFHGMILSNFSKIPFFLDEHNVEFLRFQRMKRSKFIVNSFIKWYEKISCNSAKKIFCVSDTDKNTLISKLQVDTNKISVIPNGINVEKFFPNDKNIDEIKRQIQITNESLVLFFGPFSYKPNKDAVRIIHDKILPRIIEENTNTKFLIVGDKPPLEFSHENIIFTGIVDNIEDYINASNIVICPLTSGGGTRFKILESIACGKVVISTSVGAEGIDLNLCGNLLQISDDWDEFANKILELLDTKTSNPKKEFIDKYGWKNTANAITKIMENLL